MLYFYEILHREREREEKKTERDSRNLNLMSARPSSSFCCRRRIRANHDAAGGARFMFSHDCKFLNKRAQGAAKKSDTHVVVLRGGRRRCWGYHFESAAVVAPPNCRKGLAVQFII